MAIARLLEVVGSAAEGARRNVGSNLPIGKEPLDGTRSDIDYLVPHSSPAYFKNLETALSEIDPSSGIIGGVHNPFIGPAIRFEPGVKPVLIPKQKL